jgi:hypothetical protein
LQWTWDDGFLEGFSVGGNADPIRNKPALPPALTNRFRAADDVH